MNNVHFVKIDIGKYFKNKQWVFLINMSENRDPEMFESLSGIVVGHGMDSVMLRIPYPTEYVSPESESPKPAFKLATEVMGNGIQVLADLVKVESGGVFHLKLRGGLEMYQRRQVLRIDTAIKLYQIQLNSSLDVYRKELLRIKAQFTDQGVPPSLVMRETTANLGVGGIRVECEAKVHPPLLSMFFISLHDSELPVCALGELVWTCIEQDARMCGYRFIQISKADQARIDNYIQLLRIKQKLAILPPKSNWELLDRMMCDVALA